MDGTIDGDAVLRLGTRVLWLEKEVGAIQVLSLAALIGVVVSLILIGWSWIAWRRRSCRTRWSSDRFRTRIQTCMTLSRVGSR